MTLQRVSLVEILSTESMSWRTGPDLPNSISTSSMAEYSGTLLVIGGYGNVGGYRREVDTIYQVGPLQGDTDNFTYTIISSLIYFAKLQKLSVSACIINKLGY